MLLCEGNAGGCCIMPAFLLTTNLFDYFRKTAQKHGCNPCMDHAISIIHQMNEKGSDEIPRCLMPIDIMCPCGGLDRQLAEKGECTKGVFKKL